MLLAGRDAAGVGGVEVADVAVGFGGVDPEAPDLAGEVGPDVGREGLLFAAVVDGPVLPARPRVDPGETPAGALPRREGRREALRAALAPMRPA